MQKRTLQPRRKYSLDVEKTSTHAGKKKKRGGKKRGGEKEKEKKKEYPEMVTMYTLACTEKKKKTDMEPCESSGGDAKGARKTTSDRPVHT